MKILPITTNILMIVALCYGLTVLHEMHQVSVSRFDRLEQQIAQTNAQTFQRAEELAVRTVRLELAHRDLLQRMDRIEHQIRVQSP